MIKSMIERINIFIAKSPRKAVLLGIMIFNVVFIMIAAAIIAALSQHLSGLKACSFWESVYYTITMILDAGCIDNVITDVGQAGAFAAIVCIVVIILGMVFFTGAVIGYVTNLISDFIDSKHNGKNRLYLSGHTVIINWNSRAAEIMNEFLYAGQALKIIIFVPDHKDEIDEEIRNRLDTTLIKERERVTAATTNMSFLEKRNFLRKNLLKEKITYIVREGDVAAATDLDDISISQAKNVIILDNESFSEKEGNTQTVKTLIQVSEISKANSEQTILVEVDDEWTEELVKNIIEFRGEEGKEVIIPVSYNRLLGKTNAQIAIMPKLNEVYDLLLSHRGTHFISRNVSREYTRKNENAYIEQHLISNCHSIPLTIMETTRGNQAFFMTDTLDDLTGGHERYTVKKWARLKETPVFRKRNIIILGHNSNMPSLMEGFDTFREKWLRKSGEDVLNIVLVDDEESLKKQDFYKNYPFAETITADIYDNESITHKINELTKDEGNETTVLLLSDDQVENGDIDANVLTYLIYIQGQIRERKSCDPEFTRENLDVIAEIRNPKNEEIIKNYGADQAMVSSRFVSRMIAQIGLGENTFEFFADILSYDSKTGRGEGKKIFILSAEDFFKEIPEKCTADRLIRMVFAGGEKDQKSMLLGRIRNKKDFLFFNGDQRKIEVELQPEDQLILFIN